MTGRGSYSIQPDAWKVAAPHGGVPDDWRRWADELPISTALGLVCRELGQGRGLFTMESAPLGVPNPNGSIHGGLLVAAADQCMGAVAMTLLAPGLLPVTASIHSQYHRPAMPPVTFEARVTKQGRALIFVDVDVTDAAGQLCNSSHGTMMTMEHAEARRAP